MSLTGKRILLGVTGGIAAYKAVLLLRELQNSGADVRCILTKSALRFVGKDTFSSLSRQPVPVDVFPDDEDISESWTRHVQWGEWADLFVIAPCTANTLAKIAVGLSDNMLTTAVLTARCPILICPTMDGGMYTSPATAQNLSRVKEMGYHLLEPESGYLASGLHDKGRLPETSAIIKKIESLLVKDEKLDTKPLAGKKVLVTAGATREFFDPVRFLSNPSSGKMGIAMAKAALKLGGEVTLIHGNITTPIPEGLIVESVVTTEELFERVKQYSNTDVVIMVAAVSDYRPVGYHNQKVKKGDGDLNIELERTPDILKWLGEHKKPGQTLIGFAMETENLLENASRKRTSKNADWIIANTIGTDETGFGSDMNTIYAIGAEDAKEPVVFKGPKKDIAMACLQYIFNPKH